MIYVKYHGRMGNNLFQWGFGRILSKLAGVPLRARPIPLFPITYGKILGGGRRIFSKVVKGTPLTKLNAPPVPFFPVSSKKFAVIPRDRIKFAFGETAASATIEEYVEISKQGDVLVEGWSFCKMEYFGPHRDWLARELAPEHGPYARAGPGDVVVHIRWGDYFEDAANPSIFAYPPESITRLLSSLRYDRCLIVTDTPGNALAQTLVRDFRGVVVAKDFGHDYRTLYHANRLIMSPSTFSWWAAWTGKANEIYQPHGVGAWTTGSDFGLNLPGDHVRRYNASGLFR